MMNNCLNAYPVRGVMQTANDNRIGSRNKNQPKSKKEIKSKRKRINSKDDTKRGSNVPNKDKVLGKHKFVCTVCQQAHITSEFHCCVQGNSYRQIYLFSCKKGE